MNLLSTFRVSWCATTTWQPVAYKNKEDVASHGLRSLGIIDWDMRSRSKQDRGDTSTLVGDWHQHNELLMGDMTDNMVDSGKVDNKSCPCKMQWELFLQCRSAAYDLVPSHGKLQEFQVRGQVTSGTVYYEIKKGYHKNGEQLWHRQFQSNDNWSYLECFALVKRLQTVPYCTTGS